MGAIDERALGERNPATAIVLNNLAKALRDVGRRDEAEALLQRALAIDESALGAAHPAVARDLKNIATSLLGTWTTQGRRRTCC